jgi:predicted alpha/beta-hydrolase family hydrolase
VRRPDSKTPAPKTPTPKTTPKAAPKTRARGVAGLVLAPGASAGRDQPALVAIDEALSTAGVRVERIDFPYRLAGRRAPDRPPVLLATVVEEAGTLAHTLRAAPRRIALGGRSMGGRMCSMAVADGLAAAALVLVSYPLHPPGKPERLRTEHFGAISVPCLFISGTRDAFGSPAELEAATAAIAGPVTHVWIQGGDHGLRGKDSQVAGVVRDWLPAL